MKSNDIYSVRFAILLICLVFSAPVLADVKIKTRQTAQGQSSENTTYIKGKRQRVEQNNGGYETVNIMQCDLRRNLQIMPQAKVYTVDAWANDANSAPPATVTSAKNSTTEVIKQKGGLITSTITTKDTGERKQMFGYAAKHLVVTMETKSSPEACSKNDSKMEFDGWYIDAAFVFDCLTERYKSYVPTSGTSGCQDRYETKQIGAAKRGYPVWEKTTMFDQSGKEIYSTLSEVLEISNAALDAGLFDAPADFREVKNPTELYASVSTKSSAANSYPAGNNSADAAQSGLSSSVRQMATKSKDSPTEVGAKKAGVRRIGLASVKTGAVGEGMNPAELSAAVQNSLSEYLKNPKIELILLGAKLPGAIETEAKQKECDYVLYVQVSHKKGGGGFGFGKMLGQAVAQTGIGHTGSTVGNIAGQIATASIVSAGEMSANVKAKDEITLDVSLNAPGNSVAAFTRQFKAKAKGNGDNIIVQVIEQAAVAIVDAFAK